MSGFQIPAAILSKHIAVVGMTGSGKTSTEKLLIEHVAAGHRVCILDTVKSDHWGLTSNRSGTGPGLPFQILGGPHGHVPLHAGAGAPIAELVATGKLPLSIIDMADFGPGGVQKFFNEFAPSLMRKMRGVLYLVIEEAHELAPKEKSQVPGESLATYWAKKLATAGRSKGIRLIVASQRVQALHNAVLGSCSTVIVHRMAYPADQEPVVKWLKGSVKDKAMRAQIEESMPELADGEGWICSGVAKILRRVQFPRIQTFDNSATPDDDEHLGHVVQARVDVGQLRALIGNAVDEAAANDPATLKAKISALEATVAAMGKAPAGASPDELAAAGRAGWSDGFEASEGTWRKQREGLRAAIHRQVDEAFGEAAELQERPEPRAAGAPAGLHAAFTTPAAAKALVEGVLRHEAKKQLSRIVTGQEPRADLTKGDAAILAALISFPGGRTRRQLQVLTGYAPRSLGTYLPRLLSAGYVEGRGTLMATDAGRAILPEAAPLPRGKALQDVWFGRLPEGEAKILRVLVDARGAPMTRARLQEVTQYAPRSLGTYLPLLAAKSLILSNRGEVRASPELF